MISAEFIATLRGLNCADKFQVLQLLIADLAQQETALIEPNQSYLVWSPYDAFEAADIMLDVLEHT